MIGAVLLVEAACVATREMLTNTPEDLAFYPNVTMEKVCQGNWWEPHRTQNNGRSMARKAEGA